MRQNEASALIKRRRELEEKITAIHRDFKRGLDKDSSERAVQLENAEVLNEILRVSEEELVAINEKLQGYREADALLDSDVK